MYIAFILFDYCLAKLLFFGLLNGLLSEICQLRGSHSEQLVLFVANDVLL